MKKVLLLLAFALTIPVMSQNFELSYDHSAIMVKNLKTSGNFYSEILHLKEIPVSGDNPILRWFDLGNNKQLHLIKAEKDDTFKLHKGIHLALNVQQFEDFIVHLEFNEVNYSDWVGKNNVYATRPDGVKQVYIQDPDGYWIEINDATY